VMIVDDDVDDDHSCDSDDAVPLISSNHHCFSHYFDHDSVDDHYHCYYCYSSLI